MLVWATWELGANHKRNILNRHTCRSLPLFGLKTRDELVVRLKGKPASGFGIKHVRQRDTPPNQVGSSRGRRGSLTGFPVSLGTAPHSGAVFKVARLPAARAMEQVANPVRLISEVFRRELLLGSLGGSKAKQLSHVEHLLPATEAALVLEVLPNPRALATVADDRAGFE